MTQQALVILMDWAADTSKETQEKFSAYLAKELESYDNLRGMYLDGRTMEAMIRDWVLDNGITE